MFLCRNPDSCDLYRRGGRASEIVRKVVMSIMSMAPRPVPPPLDSDERSTDSLSPNAAGAPMHSSDAIWSLRVLGTACELVLPFSRSFRVGRGAEVEVRIPKEFAGKVSREHVRITRGGDEGATWLRVRDLASKNGTAMGGVQGADFAVSAGQCFTLGDTTLLVMNKVMVRLRQELGSFLGFGEHAMLDDYVTRLPREPLVISGARGSERSRLVEALHKHTPRRHRHVLELKAPERSREALVMQVAGAAGGVVFVDLDPLKPNAALAPLMGLVFDREHNVQPIFVAPTIEHAKKVLGSAADLFRHLVIPPIASRPKDVPALLDLMLAEEGCRHRVAELGDDRLEAMRAYAWPRNRTELRETAHRIAALLVHQGNMSAAAAMLREDYETYRRALARVGAVATRYRS